MRYIVVNIYICHRVWKGLFPASMDYIYIIIHIYIYIYCGGSWNWPSPASMDYIYVLYIYINRLRWGLELAIPSLNGLYIYIYYVYIYIYCGVAWNLISPASKDCIYIYIYTYIYIHCISVRLGIGHRQLILCCGVLLVQTDRARKWTSTARSTSRERMMSRAINSLCLASPSSWHSSSTLRR